MSEMLDKNKLYFKPLEELHDSGYKMIEVGYFDGSERKPIGFCSDVINFGFFGSQEMPKDLNIDISQDGCINFWSISDELKWQRPIMSNAMVAIKEKMK